MTLQELHEKQDQLAIELHGIRMQIAYMTNRPELARVELRGMEDLIARRSPEQVARMEKERGLS